MDQIRIHDYGRLVFHKELKYIGKVNKFFNTDSGCLLVVEVTDESGRKIKKIDNSQKFRIARWTRRCTCCSITLDNYKDEYCPVCGEFKCPKPSCKSCGCSV